tara:strand:+ start:59 stop:997 length:939 start_codon:yes stop_codon:yes gene_type:complete
MGSAQKNNDRNKVIEKNLASWLLYLCSTWITLVTPVVVGFAINDAYQGKSISGMRLSFYISCFFVHLLLSFIIFYSTTKKSVTLHFDEITAENKLYKDELLPNARAAAAVLRCQTQVIYSMLLELEKVIDRVQSWPADHPEEARQQEFDVALNNLLYPLTMNRETLFSFNGKSLYNFCLYVHNTDEDKLTIRWRDHDNRLATSGRSWLPGHGHVGLTFIQDELKICQDIVESSELSSTSSNRTDEKNYRSFLSIPVRDPENVSAGRKPLGVLVFTSSSPSQFSESRDAIFGAAVASILSVFVDEFQKTESAI